MSSIVSRVRILHIMEYYHSDHSQVVAIDTKLLICQERWIMPPVFHANMKFFSIEKNLLIYLLNNNNKFTNISYSRKSPPQIVNSYVIFPLRFLFSYFWKKNFKRETLHTRKSCFKKPKLATEPSSLLTHSVQVS